MIGVLLGSKDESKEESKEESKMEGKLEDARKMLARKMSVGDIVDMTGLNERDILSLQ
jgi:hypothetical protein